MKTDAAYAHFLLGMFDYITLAHMEVAHRIDYAINENGDSLLLALATLYKSLVLGPVIANISNTFEPN